MKTRTIPKTKAMTTDAKGPTLLVTGASGQLGGRIAGLLAEAGVARLVATTRTPDRLAPLGRRGVEVRAADFDDPASLAAAFAGLDRVLIVSTDQLAIPGRRRAQHRAALDAALRAGASHVCYTSMPHPDRASPITFASDHVDMEEALHGCGVDFSILRNSWYSEDLLFILPAVLATGRWFTSAGEGRIPFVARDDTARAAVATLLGGTGRATHDIAGPEAFTVREIAALAGDVFGTEIEVVPVSDAELAVRLAEQGVPDFYVLMAVMTDANQREGRFEVGGSAVAGLTGRAPQSLRSFLTDNRAAFLDRGRRPA